MSVLTESAKSFKKVCFTCTSNSSSKGQRGILIYHTSNTFSAKLRFHTIFYSPDLHPPASPCDPNLNLPCFLDWYTQDKLKTLLRISMGSSEGHLFLGFLPCEGWSITQVLGHYIEVECNGRILPQIVNKARKPCKLGHSGNEESGLRAPLGTRRSSFARIRLLPGCPRFYPAS
jgi:hypothetical protein